MIERVYLPWVHSFEPSFAWLDNGFPDSIGSIQHKLVFGEPAGGDLKDLDVVFDLSVDHGVKLIDSIPNTLNILVVSGRLRSLLESTGGAIEFYPVRIRNLKGRMVKDSYYIANPIGWVDCMDRARSDFDESPVVRGQVRRFRRLVLNDQKIPDDRQLFRLATQKELVLVRKDLAYEIYRVHECRGMLFQKLETFGEEWR
jgi:hypothetical protein